MLRRLAGRQSKTACTGRRQHDTPAADWIAPYAYGGAQQEKAAYLREAQFRAQSLIPNSAMISTNDQVEPYERYNIHPRNKEKVGQRLSYLALNLTYGLKQVHCFSPQYKSWVAKGKESWVSFDHLEMGICRNYDLRGFEVAGEDRVFYPAGMRY